MDAAGLELEAGNGFPWQLFWQRYEAFEQQLASHCSFVGEKEPVPFAALALALESERQDVLAVSKATARPFDLSLTYIQQLTGQIAGRASRVAVRYLDDELTYAQLAAQASGVASQLIALGLPENSTIAVAAERHIALIPVLLGIFTAGHAYLPLELERYPAERLETMLEDAGVRTAVVFSAQADGALAAVSSLTRLDGRRMCRPRVETASDPDAAFGLRDFQRYQSPEHTAYLIFTSGTTGVPKGVMVAQRNLVNHNLAAIELFGLGEDDRVLQLGALGFDLSIEEIFPTLLAGARLVLLPDGVKESAPDFFGLLRKEAISVLDLPTAFWHAMVAMLQSESLPASVRLTIIGGEKASVEHAVRWRQQAPDARLINTYGPTETTIIATATENLATIGGPIANTFAYVLDWARQLCPRGMIGDLFIGGEAVSKGYLNRPDLTDAVFLIDPFAADIEDATMRAGKAPNHAASGQDLPDRMYKTGDKASFTQEGELLFFGRADRQVKVNGFRIETAEIEQVALSDPRVTDAAVIVVDLAKQGGGGKTSRPELACYFVTRDPAVTAEIVRERIENSLPAYMIPRYLLPVDRIPLNRNGKVDTAALPPVLEAVAAPSGGGCLDPDVNSTTELQIAAALRSALHIEQYDPQASFDDLGGDSLAAIQFLLEFEKLTGESVPVELLYQAESMEALARKIDEEVDKPWSALVTLKVGDGQRPPLFLIHTTPGDVLGYINLVRSLDDRTVYGIQARGLNLAAEPARTIEEMASEYLQIMREQLPDGPYYLSGWCYGGIVGIEIVAQMERLGLRPALFAPVETWGQPRPSLGLKLRKLFNLMLWGPRGWREFLSVKLGAWRGAPTVEDQDLEELDFISQRFGSSRSAAELERMKALYAINTRAADAYTMPRIASRADLLMIEADSVDGQIPDKDFWWLGIADDRHIQRFPGDHATILKEPAVRGVARSLVRLMQDADRAQAHRVGKTPGV
jgi:amino acid adenylation domain-containing protein